MLLLLIRCCAGFFWTDRPFFCPKASKTGFVRVCGYAPSLSWGHLCGGVVVPAPVSQHPSCCLLTLQVPVPVSMVPSFCLMNLLLCQDPKQTMRLAYYSLMLLLLILDFHTEDNFGKSACFYSFMYCLIEPNISNSSSKMNTGARAHSSPCNKIVSHRTLSLP